MAMKARGSVRFDEDEADLIEIAEAILDTGWTYEDVLACPVDVLAAVKAVARGRKTVRAGKGLPRAEI